MPVATAPATQSPSAASGRAIGAFARKAWAATVSTAKRGAASVIGVCGLASVAVGSGMVYRPAGFIVGGVLAVWLASLLPGGEQ